MPHSFLAMWRSEWHIPQYRILNVTSFSPVVLRVSKYQFSTHTVNLHKIKFSKKTKKNHKINRRLLVNYWPITISTNSTKKKGGHISMHTMFNWSNKLIDFLVISSLKSRNDQKTWNDNKNKIRWAFGINLALGCYFYMNFTVK